MPPGHIRRIPPGPQKFVILSLPRIPAERQKASFIAGAVADGILGILTLMMLVDWITGETRLTTGPPEGEANRLKGRR